jgi:hypothetical protein
LEQSDDGVYVKVGDYYVFEITDMTAKLVRQLMSLKQGSRWMATDES